MDKGLKILYDTYWNSIGWKDGHISNEDFITAKEEGYMFEYPQSISHTETLERINVIIKKTDVRDVANAFLYSLSSHKLEFRSALGSYWYAISIYNHEATREEHCKICDWYKWKNSPNEYELRLGYNVLNFERYKWGGIRHTQLQYALFDLEQFLLLPKVSATKDDMQILKKILDCIQKLEPKNKAGKYRDYIVKQKIIKGNKNEISVLLNILGISGILSSKEYPCYIDEFTIADGSRDPVEYNNDFSYPVNRWKASDGINTDRFKAVFGINYERNRRCIVY